MIFLRSKFFLIKSQYNIKYTFQKWKVSKTSKRTWRKVTQCSVSQMLSHSYAIIINFTIHCYFLVSFSSKDSVCAHGDSSERTDKQYHIINYKGNFRWWQCSEEIKFWCCDSNNLGTGSIRRQIWGPLAQRIMWELRSKRQNRGRVVWARGTATVKALRFKQPWLT